MFNIAINNSHFDYDILVNVIKKKLFPVSLKIFSKCSHCPLTSPDFILASQFDAHRAGADGEFAFFFFPPQDMSSLLPLDYKISPKQIRTSVLFATSPWT